LVSGPTDDDATPSHSGKDRGDWTGLRTQSTVTDHDMISSCLRSQLAAATIRYQVFFRHVIPGKRVQIRRARPGESWLLFYCVYNG
jgi:hypothetical protein